VWSVVEGCNHECVAGSVPARTHAHTHAHTVTQNIVKYECTNHGDKLALVTKFSTVETNIYG
jgi:hypothetical protein